MKNAAKEILTAFVLFMGTMFVAASLVPLMLGDTAVGGPSPWAPVVCLALIAAVWLARRAAYSVCAKLDLSGWMASAVPEATAMLAVFAPLLAILAGWRGTDWLWLLATIAVASVALGVAKARKAES